MQVSRALIKMLKSIGRKHRPEDSVKAIDNAVKTGFKWINVDLMFLTPSIKSYIEMNIEDKLRVFKRDLEKTMELGVHQLTYYATVVPSYSPGHKLVEMKRLVQELDYIDLFVKEALDFVMEKRLVLTRVYSASVKGYEYATVNLEMIGPLLGFGAGAWSNTGLYQYINTHSLENYVNKLSNGTPPVVYIRKINNRSRTWRFSFDQLSTGRVNYSLFELIDLERPLLTIRLLLRFMSLRT